MGDGMEDDTKFFLKTLAILLSTFFMVIIIITAFCLLFDYYVAYPAFKEDFSNVTFKQYIINGSKYRKVVVPQESTPKCETDFYSDDSLKTARDERK